MKKFIFREVGTPAGTDIVQISNTEQKIPSEDTSDEDEDMLFKRLQSNQQQIDPSRREEDDDEDGEQEEQEVRSWFLFSYRKSI